MKKLKINDALLCKIYLYALLFTPALFIFVIIPAIPLISDLVKAIVLFTCLAIYLVAIFKNAVVLFTVDSFLSVIEHYNNARRQFNLPETFSPEQTEKKLLKFGTSCSPLSSVQTPNILQYRFTNSFSTLSKGKENVILTYHTDFLNEKEYNNITDSANKNSFALKGKKKPKFLSSEQKDAPLTRLTIVFIFAKTVDQEFLKRAYDTVCKQEGDDFDNSFLPCIIDLQNRICIFNSLCSSEIIIKPVKNVGIKFIKNYIFDGILPLINNEYMLDPSLLDKDIDLNQSLFDFWQSTKLELKHDDDKEKKLFEEMNHKDIVLKDDYLYVKWFDKGIVVWVGFDEEEKVADVLDFDSWDYPNISIISRKVVKELKKMITDYLKELGYTTEID